jgi:hypothetical protein
LLKVDDVKGRTPLVEFYRMKVSCWSINCGENIIRYNEANFTFWSNSAETNKLGVDGTYIFLVEMDQIDKVNLKEDKSFIETYTFVFDESTIEPPKGISIDVPFD